MHLLTATKLEELIADGKHVRVQPFERSMLQHTCYYLRISGRSDTKQGDNWVRGTASDNGALTIKPRSFVRVWTLESVCLSADVLGVFGQVSDLIEEGLLLVHSPFVDPLFEGQLRLGLHNLTNDPVSLKIGTPLAKIAFFDVTESRVSAPLKGSIMDAKLQAFRSYIERSDISPFPPESLEDDK
jgi:deoxycytidine triphosphate deaminase